MSSLPFSCQPNCRLYVFPCTNTNITVPARATIACSSCAALLRGQSSTEMQGNSPSLHPSHWYVLCTQNKKMWKSQNPDSHESTKKMKNTYAWVLTRMSSDILDRTNLNKVIGTTTTDPLQSMGTIQHNRGFYQKQTSPLKFPSLAGKYSWLP